MTRTRQVVVLALLTGAAALIPVLGTGGSRDQAARSARNQVADGSRLAKWSLEPDDHVEELCRLLIASGTMAPEAAEILREVASRRGPESAVIRVLVQLLQEDDRASAPLLSARTSPFVVALLQFHRTPLAADVPAIEAYKRQATSSEHKTLIAWLGDWPRVSSRSDLPTKVALLSPKEIVAEVRRYALAEGPDTARSLALLLQQWGSDSTKDFHRQVFIEEILKLLPYDRAAAVFEVVIDASVPDDLPTVMPPLANQIGVALGKRIIEPHDYLLAAARAEDARSAVVRMMFVVALGSTKPGSPIAELSLLRVASQDPSTAVRHAAVVNLARVAPADTILGLVDSLLQYPDTEAQALQAMTALLAVHNLTETNPSSVVSARHAIAKVLQWPQSPLANRVKVFSLAHPNADVYAGLRDVVASLTRDPDEAVSAAASRALTELDR